jgi:hypothetical protein
MSDNFLAPPHPANLRLGAVRLWLTNPTTAFQLLLDHHSQWAEQAGLASPPTGGPRRSKMEESSRLPLVWGLTNSDNTPTPLGNAFKLLAPATPAQNPYSWRDAQLLAGTYLVLQANGAWVWEFLRRPWPEGLADPNDIERLVFETLIGLGNRSEKIQSQIDRWSRVSRDYRRKAFVFPWCEPLRELGLLTGRGQVGQWQGYVRTPRALDLAAAIDDAGSVRSFLERGIVRWWRATEGQTELHAPTIAELLGQFNNIPVVMRISESEIPFELFSLVVAANLAELDPTVCAEAASTLELLRGARGPEGHQLIEVRNGQHTYDLPNLFLTDPTFIQQYAAAPQDPLAAHPTESRTAETDSPTGQRAPNNQETLSSAEIPVETQTSSIDPDRTLDLLWALFSLTAPLHAAHPLALSPPTPLQTIDEVHRLISGVPENLLREHRDPNRHPLHANRAGHSEEMFVWHDPTGRKNQSGTDSRPRRINHLPTILRTLEPCTTSVPRDAPSYWAMIPPAVLDLQSAFAKPDEPTNLLGVRINQARSACAQAGIRLVEDLRTWIRGESPALDWRGRLAAQVERWAEIDRYCIAAIQELLAQELLESEDNLSQLLHRPTLRAEYCLDRLQEAQRSWKTRGIVEVDDDLRGSGITWTVIPKLEGEAPQLTPHILEVLARLKLAWDGQMGPVVPKPTPGEGAIDPSLLPSLPQTWVTRNEIRDRVQMKVASQWNLTAGGLGAAVRLTPEPPPGSPSMISWMPEVSEWNLVDTATDGHHRPALDRWIWSQEATLPADQIVQGWIALETLHEDSIERSRRLAALVTLTVFRARLLDQAKAIVRGLWSHLVEHPGSIDLSEREFNQNFLLDLGLSESTIAHLHQPVAIRRNFQLPTRDMTPQRVFASIAHHPNKWLEFMNHAPPRDGRVVAALELVITCGALTQGGKWVETVGPALGEMLRDAVALERRVFALRNRIVHEGFGLDPADQPVLRRVAERMRAIYWPALAWLFSDPAPEAHKFDATLVSLRDFANLGVLSKSELDNRRSGTLQPENLLRWLNPFSTGLATTE